MTAKKKKLSGLLEATVVPGVFASPYPAVKLDVSMKSIPLSSTQMFEVGLPAPPEESMFFAKEKVAPKASFSFGHSTSGYGKKMVVVQPAGTVYLCAECGHMTHPAEEHQKACCAVSSVLVQSDSVIVNDGKVVYARAASMYQ